MGLGSARIGFFGGSFDPPHCGHLAVARAVADAFALDQVLFAPVAEQPLKPAGSNAAFADRLAMVELLCAGSGDVRLLPSAVDAPRPVTPSGLPAPNFTADTLTRLSRALGEGSALFAIVGADAFLGLPRWRDPARLLQLCDWIVVSRPGFALEQIKAMGFNADQLCRVHCLEGVAEPASATHLRALLSEPGGRQEAELHALLPAAVLAYIRSHHLYAA
jgi:nicotinate-nucleotide adenylyltransferase